MGTSFVPSKHIVQATSLLRRVVLWQMALYLRLTLRSWHQRWRAQQSNRADESGDGEGMAIDDEEEEEEEEVRKYYMHIDIVRDLDGGCSTRRV